jgi:anti-sigma factor RsiW
MQGRMGPTMENQMENKMNCKTCQSVLPDLLLAPDGAAKNQTAAEAHIAGCAECARELASLKATFALLDLWTEPEISPYFDQKLAVRLREEQAAPAASWFEQLRARLLFNTGRQFRPALATAMALVLVIGGGGIGISTFPHAAPVQPSATVNDLQILDKNEQAIQQMDQLLQEDGATDDSTSAQPAS